MFESAYSTLRLSPGATPEAARQAFVRLARRYPPEQFPEKFAAVQAAYRQLTLGDDLLFQGFSCVNTMDASLALAGLLWGDLPELRSGETDLTSLVPLLEEKTGAGRLNALLDAIDVSTIVWSKP